MLLLYNLHNQSNVALIILFFFTIFFNQPEEYFLSLMAVAVKYNSVSSCDSSRQHIKTPLLK